MAARVITSDDPDYPPLLRECSDRPRILHVDGRLELRRPIAIVGSRRADAYGLAVAESFTRALVGAGFEIVSGLAYGIDAAAHRAAIAAGGRTIAVLGSGLGKIYPKDHASLAAQIVESGGAIVSEFATDAPPERDNFPRRNRIVAGMTLGTLVVSAAKRSGALITARRAGDYGRSVWAVPNRIGEENALGAFALLRDGATLAASAADIIDDLQTQR